MKITIDPNTLAEYKARGITEVFVGFVSGGCSGTKISVTEDFERADQLESYPQWYGITVFIRPTDTKRLDGGIVTRTREGKWVFSSPQVQSRCGCGSSFGFEKKAIDPSKLKELRKIFGKKEEICE